MKKILIICFVVILCNPVYSMTYEEYQGKLLLQQAKEWKERVGQTPSVVRKGLYGQIDEPMFGVMIDRENGRVIIRNVLKGSVAEKYGIKPGMYIDEIDGSSVSMRKTYNENLWNVGRELTQSYVKYIYIDGQPYKKDSHLTKNENYDEFMPKVYLDLASINIRNGAVFFWIKFLNGNKLFPITDKNIYYFENAYVIDLKNNKFAEILVNGFTYDGKQAYYKHSSAQDIQKVKNAFYKPGILGHDPYADYSEIVYEDIVENTAMAFLKKIMIAFFIKSKSYQNKLDFQATLRYF